MDDKARLSVDIGGTFTDVALQLNEKSWSAKVLTTPQAPEDGLLIGVEKILAKAGIHPSEVGILIHGTTLATNALIERKGAITALIVTEGFRDSLEMAFENRFEQYDIFMDKPAPLVPRALRLTVPERVDARGNVVLPLDEDAVKAIAVVLKEQSVTSVAIGFLHSYAWPEHELRVKMILQELIPELWITCSSDVSPEIREYERWSTACANAYVQPVMAGYLNRLKKLLKEKGYQCPVFLMTSAGGLTTLETAVRFPIRLVESGPAGGAILAARVADQCSLEHVVSFDMGGTTAKICLIDHGEPQYARTFEVARAYRFMKGSGLPLRIPVVEMVEIGAGGGSIATVDAMKRIQVGPQSAGSEPGPACYGLGGTQPTVTDADMVLGVIDPARFAGGSIAINTEKAIKAMNNGIGSTLDFSANESAYGIVEVVEENMANAARVHAVERGKELTGRTMVAFGGAAPLHAARLAEKLGISKVLIPTGAGVGSAIGFLLAPVAFETVRTRYTPLNDEFNASAVNQMRDEMRLEASNIIRQGGNQGELLERWTADIRYKGQGHELTVDIPRDEMSQSSPLQLLQLFNIEYENVFGITIPGMEAEIMSWALRMSAPSQKLPQCPPTPTAGTQPKPVSHRDVFDPQTGLSKTIPLYWRFDLHPGQTLRGPAIIAEEETSTLVTEAFTVSINGLGYIEMTRSEHQ